ncbi:MAG: GNAT family N-acetyltransferase [Ruminiclostridium sp.]|nr:GNAT family N-acetyltransferase [Ruminiclostridium sp.]
MDLKIIRFFESDSPAHWLEEIKRCDWNGGKYLHGLLWEGTFFDIVGKNSEVLLLTDGDELISFCTYAEKDDIQPTELTPWIGFVYTFPKHRGHRYMGLLFEEAERLAKNDHFSGIYISTDHTGLYEKYGCEYMTELTDIHGNPSRVYVKKLNGAE